jgi:DNA replication protein DnaC
MTRRCALLAMPRRRGQRVDDLELNVICIGPPGTGKTHCLLALGLFACTRGFRALFITAAELLMGLIAAKHDGLLERRLRAYERIGLLLIDELGYIPFEREATELLFEVISRRYKRQSIAISTNLAFTDWTNIFPIHGGHGRYRSARPSRLGL